ncbi:MAG: UDP-N-acetylglucosamine 2-epimerase (non-hydrolyzing), partial [Candidatus Hadarchaeum sp.]|uniref:non-hydrolyzing UDP-N-acetylglucosamine 2-epimerase n=1 Tax=Candidatus Hadarchaeum sp. TaxID=2883567 RepID=UPI00316EC023
IPVAHVEAGLRSFNKRMAEEINRVLTDHISDLLFCPTQTAVENLRREGITQGVYLVGDVMYDAALQYLALAERKSRILERLGLKPKDYALATVHRAENTDDPQRLRAIFAGLEAIAQAGLLVILPLHPRTRKQAEALGLSPNGVQVLEPVSYLDMLLLEKNARVILTDSGGVQKEAFFFRVPCVTLREETEWVETVETGWNVVAGANRERIVGAVTRGSLGQKTQAHIFGCGRSAERIVELLVNKP